MKYEINFDRLRDTRLKTCPCKIIGEELLSDVICPCIEFIETGECICGVFKQVKERKKKNE